MANTCEHEMYVPDLEKILNFKSTNGLQTNSPLNKQN